MKTINNKIINLNGKFLMDNGDSTLNIALIWGRLCGEAIDFF